MKKYIKTFLNNYCKGDIEQLQDACDGAARATAGHGASLWKTV